MQNEDILTTVQWDIAERLLPATVILYFLIVIGIFGNISTIAFYVKLSKRTPTTLLIKSMAIADLGTCLAAIPVISEMMINVNYSLAIMCKLTHFFGLWAGACACLLLWLISIDRYRKICNPLGKQMTASTTKYLVIGITAFSFLLAVRLLVTFDTVDVEVRVEEINSSVTGQHCATNGDHKLLSLAFYSTEFLLILMIWITVIVTYIRIIYIIVKRRLYLTKPSTLNDRFGTLKSGVQRYTKKKIFQKDQNLGDIVLVKGREHNDTELNDISQSEVIIDDREIYKVDICIEVQTNKQRSSSEIRSQKTTFDYSNTRKPSEVKLSLMMFSVSMIFILCFSPYFAIRIFIRIVLDSGKEYDFNAGIQLALKLPYVNSALTPIMYFIFNQHLRRYVQACFTRCWS